MGRQYHDSLVEAVGTSFYYYTHHKDFDLTRANAVDFETFTNGWIKKYSGNWDVYGNSAPIEYNAFKPCVDQLVYRILTVTEDEIERRVSERVNEFISKANKKGDE